MRAVTVIALLIALVALGLAGFALTAAAAARTDLAAARTRTDELGAQVGKLQQQVDAAKAEQAKAAEAKIDATAVVAAKPAADGTIQVQLAPAAPAAVDDEHIKKVVQDELQAQFQRMRQQFGGGTGGGGWGQAPLSDAATVKSQLGVDDEQKAEQTAKIIADMRSATRELWRGGGDRDANMKKMQDLRTEAETKLADVLTADQLTKAKQLLDQGGGRRGRGPGGPGGGEAQPAPAEQPKGTSF